MSQWHGKSRGTPLGYRIFVWVLKNLGVSAGYFVLRFVAFYFYLFSYRASKEIYSLFHKRLGYGKLASLDKLYQNYVLLRQSIIDKVVIMSGI